jgi:hypothetical protein
MKITKKSTRKFQEGGAMEDPNAAQAPEEGVVPEQGGEDPMAQLVQMAAQAVQSQDAQLAMQVCQAIVELAQGGGGGAPEEQGEPVYRKGGVLAYRIKK